MNPMAIEHLGEETNLSGNDLMMASVLHGDKYDSSKVTLANIAEYVKRSISTEEDSGGSGGGSSGSYGYEMYDLTEDTDGIYNSVAEYQASPHDYVWYLTVAGEQFAPAGNNMLTKTVNHDCVVFIDGIGGQDDDIYNETSSLPISESNGWNIKINNMLIWTIGFRNNTGERTFYLKSGQTLKIDTMLRMYVTIIPLLQGGKFFIDPDKTPESGVISSTTTYTASRPTLFVHNYPPAFNTNSDFTSKIQGKYVIPMERGGQYQQSTYFILNTGQTIEPKPYAAAQYGQAKWKAYALL